MGLFDKAALYNSGYVPQFVGSARQELENVGDTLDKRYRTNKDYADKIAMSIAQEDFGNDTDIQKEHIDKIKNTIHDVASSPESFENSTGIISNLAKDVFTDPYRIAALRNQELRKKDQELERMGFDLNFGDDRTTHKTRNEDGSINTFNLKREKREDYAGAMKNLIGKIADDGKYISPTGKTFQFDNTERMALLSGHLSEVSPEKARALVDALIPAYKSNKEGNQDVRRLTNIEGLPSQDVQVPIRNKKGVVVGYRMTNPVDEDIRQRFNAIVAPQIYKDTNMQLHDFGLSAAERAKQAQQDADSYFSGNEAGSYQDNTSLQTPDVVENNPNYEKDFNGNYVQYYNKATGQPVTTEFRDAALKNKIPGAVFNGGVPDNIGVRTVNPQEAEKTLTEKYDNIQKQYPGLYKDYNHYKQSLLDASKDHAKVTPTGNNIGENQAKTYDDYLNRQVATKSLFTTTGSEPTNLENIASQAGVDKSKIKLKAIQTFYDSPNAKLPGGYIEAKVEAEGAKGSNYPSTVLVPLNNQFVGLSNTIDHLYKNSLYKGDDQYTPDKPYFPVVGNNYMENAQGRLGFYTTTIPIPKEQRGPNQPAFKTVVHSVIAHKNENGQWEVLPRLDQRGEEETQDIDTWKNHMVKALSPLFMKSLNSGQTISAKDIKEAGLNY